MTWALFDVVASLLLAVAFLAVSLSAARTIYRDAPRLSVTDSVFGFATMFVCSSAAGTMFADFLVALYRYHAA
jgi:hypothetical protein